MVLVRCIIGVRGWCVVLVLLLGSSCYFRSEGQSPRQIKSELKDSFLIRSAHIFYPSGPPDDPADLPVLTGAQTREIRRGFEDVASAIKKMHAAHVDALSRLFGRPLARDIHIQITITSEPGAVARIESEGTLFINARVAQAFYRTAVVAGIGAAHQQQSALRDLGADRAGAEPPTERALLQEFFALVKRVDAIEDSTLVGALWKARHDDDMTGGWFEAVDVQLVSVAIGNHYLGPILFALGHEIGHQVLGHFRRPRLAQDDCAGFDALELEADAYAVALYALATSNLAMFGGILDLDAQSGFADFFRYTYELSGFSAVKPQGCHYPDPADRRTRADALYGQIRNGQIEAAWQQAISRASRGQSDDQR